jgi:hypothetical protein
MAVSFAADIRPLFTETDIDHMGFFCDLSSYDDVKNNSAAILGRLNGTSGPQMPPVSTGGPWPPAHITLFQTWITDGSLP